MYEDKYKELNGLEQSKVDKDYENIINFIKGQ